MEMDDEERQLVQDANAQAGEGAPDAAPPVPQDEDEDIMVSVLSVSKSRLLLAAQRADQRALDSGNFASPLDGQQHRIQQSQQHGRQRSLDRYTKAS